MFRELLQTPTEKLGRAGRFTVFQIKLWSHCAHLLKKNRAPQQAAALAYHTIFGLVPLAVVMLMVFQAFEGYREIGLKVKIFLYQQLHLSQIQIPDPQNPDEMIMLTRHINELVARVVTGLNEGTIALISGVLILWAAIALLSTIEKAFNNIWHVVRGRSFIQRVINYWALLTLGPLLLALGVYLSTRYAIFGRLEKTVLLTAGPAVLSYLVSVFGFFLLYYILPNTRVKAKIALWGAVLAALLWSIAKLGFGLYITELVPFSKVYGVLGLVPLTVLWIYIGWLIVLFGVQLSFTTQHLSSLDTERIESADRSEERFIANEMTAINIVREVAAAFEKRQQAVGSEMICSRLDIPADFAEKILDHLVRYEIIARVSEPVEGYVPATDPANIGLADISDVVAEAGMGMAAVRMSEKLRQIKDYQREILDRYRLADILESSAEQPAGSQEPEDRGVNEQPGEQQ